MDFRGFDLRDLITNGCVFKRCDFRGADLRCADLIESKFYSCEFEGADLRLAHIKTYSPIRKASLEMMMPNISFIDRHLCGKEMQNTADDLLYSAYKSVESGDPSVPDGMDPDGHLAKWIKASVPYSGNPIARDFCYEMRLWLKMPNLSPHISPLTSISGRV